MSIYNITFNSTDLLFCVYGLHHVQYNCIEHVLPCIVVDYPVGEVGSAKPRDPQSSRAPAENMINANSVIIIWKSAGKQEFL